MISKTHLAVAGLLLTTVFPACGHRPPIGGHGHGGRGGQGGTGGSGGQDPRCPVVVADADCDTNQRPFVFVHGTFGSGDNIAHVASLFGSNGYCQDRFVAIDYNSLGDAPGAACEIVPPATEPPRGCGKIDALIDSILEKTGATQVDLAGHSQGTRHCASYLADPARAAKVAHYINYSGGVEVPNAVPTLSLSSERDIGGVARHATGANVTTVTFQDEDHFAVAASKNAFIETWKFLHDGATPAYTTVQCGGPTVTVEGVAETFADNVPVTGKIEVRVIGDMPRAEGTPLMVIEGRPDGRFGPIELQRHVAYEMKGFGSDGALIGYQYFTPFKRSNRLARLLTPPADPALRALSTDRITRGPNHVAWVARSAAGGFRQDLGDSLRIDGAEVLTSENSGAGALATPALGGGIVGMFFYDANANGQTELGLPFSTAFIAGTDVFLDASTPEFIELDYNGGRVKVSNWPSSDALVSVMFQ